MQLVLQDYYLYDKLPLDIQVKVSNLLRIDVDKYLVKSRKLQQLCRTATYNRNIMLNNMESIINLYSTCVTDQAYHTYIFNCGYIGGFNTDVGWQVLNEYNNLFGQCDHCGINFFIEDTETMCEFCSHFQ